MNIVLKFFRRLRRKEALLKCPACGRELSMRVTDSDVTNTVKVIQKKYACAGCALEYSAVELIAPESEPGSPTNILGSLIIRASLFDDMTSDLEAALRSLQTVLAKINTDIVRQRHDGNGMN